jgi:hypothetical protein
MTDSIPALDGTPAIDDLGALQVLQARAYLRQLRDSGALPVEAGLALGKLDGALHLVDVAAGEGRTGIHRDGDDGINATLHRAVGLDPETNHGFRLSVMPGEWPMIEAIPLLPATEGGVARTFVEHLAAVGQQLLLMPADAPMASLAVSREDDFDIRPGHVSDEGAVYVDGAELTPGHRVIVLIPVDQAEPEAAPPAAGHRELDLDLPVD